MISYYTWGESYGSPIRFTPSIWGEITQILLCYLCFVGLVFEFFLFYKVSVMKGFGDQIWLYGRWESLKVLQAL